MTCVPRITFAWQVFHGMVYSDLMTNPLLVPVTILRGHEVVDFQVMRIMPVSTILWR